MIVDVLAILSASAAVGMRIAIPLLIIGLLQTDLWSQVPLLSRINPQVLIAVLTSWSLFELFGSKKLLGQRILQIIQLFFTPFVGGLVAVTVTKMAQLNIQPLWIVATLGALFALALKLVQMAWFFRLRGIPLWAVFLEDILCVVLIIFAFKAPINGGLIAMLLFWLAIRSTTKWRKWYLEGKKARSPNHLPPD
ncbi:MAG: DUF4126 domain-containing protein [Snowella sp.]|nr:DUF4126 domain-containing protein [Snowella sp.]